MIAPRKPTHEPSSHREVVALRRLRDVTPPSWMPSARTGSTPQKTRDESQCETDVVSSSRVLALRILFALDVIGAGVPGLLLLFSSSNALEWLFASRMEPGPATAMLGCVWLSMGVLAIAGLFRPVTFSPLLLLQLLYKAIWLGCFGLPTLWNGEMPPVIATAVFLTWVVAVAATLPWRILFANEIPSATLLTARHAVQHGSSRKTIC